MTTPSEGHHPSLTAYRIHLSDGTSYATSMAAGVTQAMAEEYFLGHTLTHENSDGSEIHRVVDRVEQVTAPTTP